MWSVVLTESEHASEVHIYIKLIMAKSKVLIMLRSEPFIDDELYIVAITSHAFSS